MKKKYYLAIGVKVNNVLLFKLLSIDRSQKNEISFKKLDQVILPGLKKFLKSKKLELKDLAGFLIVNDGHSFVTTRVLLSTINTLAWVLNKSVIAISSKQLISLDYQKAKQALGKSKRIKFVEPYYHSKPQITLAKSKFVFK